MQVSKLNKSLLYKIEKYINEIPKPKFRRMVVSKELYELLKKNFPDEFIFE